MSYLKERLGLLEARNAGRKKQDDRKMMVYYGWSRLNKVQKREGIAVFFENEPGAGSETSRSGKTLKKLIDIVAVRPQNENEKSDAQYANRAFTVYYVFLDDKAVKGSLERALTENNNQDARQVPEELRKEINDKLRKRFMETHPDYREPET